jgi:hypothetical protein
MVRVGTILSGMGRRKCDDILCIIVSINEDDYALIIGIGDSRQNTFAISVDEIKHNCFKIDDAHTGDLGDFNIGDSELREKREKRFIKEEYRQILDEC